MSRYARQLSAAAANYDNASPPEESDYGYDDADVEIATELVEADEVGELVMDVREAADLLNWISYNVQVPTKYLHKFRELDRRAKGLEDRACKLLEANA
jgi:hypothetical protein